MCENSNNFNFDEVNKICSLHKPTSRLRYESLFLDDDKGATQSVTNCGISGALWASVKTTISLIMFERCRLKRFVS